MYFRYALPWGSSVTQVSITLRVSGYSAAARMRSMFACALSRRLGESWGTKSACCRWQLHLAGGGGGRGGCWGGHEAWSLGDGGQCDAPGPACWLVCHHAWGAATPGRAGGRGGCAVGWCWHEVSCADLPSSAPATGSDDTVFSNKNLWIWTPASLACRGANKNRWPTEASPCFTCQNEPNEKPYAYPYLSTHPRLPRVR